MQTSDARRHLFVSVGFGLVGLGFSAGWLAQARLMETPVSVVCEPPPPSASTCPPAPPLTPERSVERSEQGAPRFAAVLGAGAPFVAAADALEPDAETDAEAEPAEPPEPDDEQAEEPDERSAAESPERPTWDGPFLGDEALDLTVGQTHEVHVRGRIANVQVEPPLLTWSYTPEGLRLFAAGEGTGSLTVETEDARVIVAVTVAPAVTSDEGAIDIDLGVVRLPALSVVSTRSRP